MRNNAAYLAACAAMVAGTILPLCAEEVAAEDARAAAQGWAALREALTGKDRFQGAEIADVKAYEGKDGRGAFYVVSFSGGGFAVTSGDTEIAPILAYSEDGEFVASDENPLWVMLTTDVAGRTKRLANGEQGAGNGTRRLLKAASKSSETSANASTWARLKEAAADATGASLPKRPLLKAALPRTGSIATPIYGPLCETKWNQYFISGTACYNYYTPSNFLSGCVATAMGQMMRSFEWPKEKVTLLREHSSRFLDDVKMPGVVYTNQWHVGGGYGQSWEYPGPEFGGPYDWENMIANPPAAKSAGTLTEDHCKAIGRLLRDCGITVNMDYHLGGSGADTCAIAAALVQDFGYKNAEYRSDGTDISLEEQLAAYLPSFAMGSPCAVGIPGHAIVADGYGLDSDSRQYVHYNYGGGGSYWYTPPDDKETDVEYPTVKKIVYNIMTPEERYAGYVAGGCFVGGTVLEDDGATPVAGATVTALDAFNGSKVSGATDENGQYVLHLPPGYDYTLSAEVDGDTVSTKKLGMVRSTPGAVGNRRNVRLVAGDIAAGAEASLVHRWSFNGTDDANFTDSIGGAVAKVMKKTSTTTTVDGGTVTWADGKAVLSGGNGTGHLNFGEGVMGTGDGATLEVWATKTANPAGWAYLVNYELIDSTTANHLSLALDLGGSNSSWGPSRWGQTENRVAGNKSGGVNVLSPPAGVPFHVTLSLEDKGDGSSDVRWMVSDAATGFIYSKQSINVKNLTPASAAADGWALLLGNNPWTNSTKDLACEIDEVRIWDGVLSDEQIKANIIAGPDNPLGGGTTSVVIPENTTYTVPTLGGYGYMTFSPVTLGEGSKIRFETTDYFGTGLRFKTGGIFVPSGSVLDYVELSDPENYTAAMEDADTILVRLKGDIAHESVWKGGDFANPANWESVNAAGETISAAPGGMTTVIIPASELAAFGAGGGSAGAWGRIIAGGRTATQCGRCGTKPDPRYSAFRDIAPEAYASLGALGIDAVNGGPNTEWQAENLANAQVRFDGWVHVESAQAGKWDIQTDFDNCSAFAIDGSWVFVNPKWEPDTVAAGCFVSEGWHRFTFIAGDTGRSERGCEVAVGESTEENPKVPFSISVNGAEPVAFHTFTFGSDSDDIVLSGDADWTALGTLDVAPGTTIDLGGHRLKVSGLASDGVGAGVVNSSPSTGGLVVESTAADAISSVAIDDSVEMLIDTALTHRWSFNDDWSDSVGGAAAQKTGTYAALYGGRVHTGYGGCGHDTGNVNLGANLLDTDEATIELWVRQDGVEKYSRVFTYGQDSSQFIHMAWSSDTDISKDEVGAKSPGTSQGIYKQNTMAPYEIGTDYYIAMTFRRQGDAMLVSWQRRDAGTGELQKSGSLTMTQGIHTFTDPIPYLGRSVYTGNCDAMAAYDEVRIWRGVLTDGQLAASAAAGPDAAISIADGTPQFVAPEPPEPPGQRAAMPDGAFRLMTYNINYAYDAATQTIIEDRIADRIIRENPDFCCLNEIRDTVGHPEATVLAKLTGMHKTFYGEGSQGNCVLSKEEPVSWKWTALSHAGYKRFLVVAEFDKAVIAATHLEQAGNDTITAHDARMASIPEIRESLSQYAESGKPVFLCGDWNAGPGSDEIALMKEFMTIISPTNGVRTYHGRKATGGSIIDYIAVDTAHADDIYTASAYVIDDIAASDHNPVFAEIYLRPAASTLGWIDERFLTTGLTGEWYPGISWDPNTWTAVLSSDNTFKVQPPSAGTNVTLTVTVAFDAVPMEEATPDETAQGAVWLGTNGCFQVWTKELKVEGGELKVGEDAAWLDVEAEGVTPAPGVEYTFRVVFDYTAGTYSVDVQDGTEWRSLAGRDVPIAPQTDFPLAAEGTSIAKIRFNGDGVLRSITGEYVVAEGFSAEDEVVLKGNASVILDAAKAAWLNSCAGGKTAVGTAAAGLSAADFDAAYLLNLDITDEDRSYAFEVTDVAVGEAAVVVTVTLTRQGAIAAPVNGRLKFYGAATLEAFRTAAAGAIDATLSDDDFSEGGTATAEIPLKGDTPPAFFKATIE